MTEPESAQQIRDRIEREARRRYPSGDLNAPGTGFGASGYLDERFADSRIDRNNVRGTHGGRRG